MSDERTQSVANHRAIPQNFLIAIFILAVDVILRIWYTIQAPSFGTIWSVVVGAALIALFFNARRNALTNQDRIIRLEMRLRLYRLLDAEKRDVIRKLTLPQLIALRFASDAELPALVDAVLAENITKQNDIKQRIKDWQADWVRV